MWLAAVLEQRNLGARTTGESTSVTMPGGLIAGTETMLFYTLFFLFPKHLAALFATMAALVIVTAAQRVVWAARHL